MKSIFLVLVALLFQGSQESPGSIEGYVIKAGTSTPIARARVTLRKEGVAGSLTATTDESGKYLIRDVPPGRYSVLASRDGYVPAQFGENPDHPGSNTMLTLQSRQELKDIVIALTAKSAISGRVYDRFGDPVVNADVQALRHTYQDGHRILIPADSVRTNDLGEYRLFWLVPGQYIVSATPAAARPETRPAVSGPQVPQAPETFLPVYFAGTTDAAAAMPIDLGPGVNLTGVDFGIVDTRAVRVRGRVTSGVTGQPAVGAGITLVPRRGTVATGSLQRAYVSNTGNFEFLHMAPGAYDIVATAQSLAGRLVAHVPVDVGNADVDNVGLVLQPQFNITGRITLENAPTSATTAGLDSVRIQLRHEPYTPELLVLIPNVAPDGSFSLSGVTSGDYQIKVGLNSFPGYVKSIRFGAVNALNPPFHIDAPAPLDIVLSLNSGSLDGVVADEMQKPVNDATVVLVPDPPRRQRFDLYSATGSDASGQFHLKNLSPGDYRIFAWADVPAGAWEDPDFLRAYEDRGKPVRVLEGSQENVELRLIP